MAEPPKIDGTPETMGNYDTTTNMKDFNPQEVLRSAMTEGEEFAAKDGKAIEYLRDFVTQTAMQLRSATNTARANKLEYDGADKHAVTTFLGVAFQPSSLKEPDA